MGGRAPEGGGAACRRRLGRGRRARSCAGSAGTRTCHGPSGAPVGLRAGGLRRRGTGGPGLRPACRLPLHLFAPLAGLSAYLAPSAGLPPYLPAHPPARFGFPRACGSREAAPGGPDAPRIFVRGSRPRLWEGTTAVQLFWVCYSRENPRPPYPNLRFGCVWGGPGRPQVRAGAWQLGAPTPSRRPAPRSHRGAVEGGGAGAGREGASQEGREGPEPAWGRDRGRGPRRPGTFPPLGRGRGRRLHTS